MLDNARWEKFCQAYAQDGNASAAYRAAGYKPRTDAACRVSASQLLTNPNIQHRINELTAEARAQAERSAIADIREIRETMTAIMRGEIAETKPADRIKAGDFLARVGGQAEPETVKVELSLADKRARLRELLYGDDSDD